LTCRICGAGVEPLLDLGIMPPANRLKRAPEESDAEFPLVLEFCGACRNLQLRDCLDEEMLYSNYFYMTPQSSSLERHYEMLSAHMTARGFLTERTDVLEIGSNRGAFLEYLKPSARSVQGVDPAENIAAVANQRGIKTTARFFSERLVDETGDALLSDLIITRHTFAHNKDPHSILRGIKKALRRNGVLLIENNYAGSMLEGGEFDQIYHEHMFYYSITSLSRLISMHGLRLIDVIMTPVHGGSFVAFIADEDSNHSIFPSVSPILESEASILTQDRFMAFADAARRVKTDLSELVGEIRAAGGRIMAYGATAKGATLLNYSGLSSPAIEAVADSTPGKLGFYVPKANVKIISEEEAFENAPDFFLLTAWNYQDELIRKARSRGVNRTRFIVPIPRVSLALEPA
jgi:SAM-dependent methyltransferase